MKLAIIAAGEGSRLQSEGISIPKPLIKVNGIPLIDRIIRIAQDNNITGVFCIVNEYSTIVKDHLANGNYKIPITVLVKSTPSSLHSLYELRGFLDDNFILTTADTVFSEKEFRGFIQYIHSNTRFDVLLSVTRLFGDDKPLCVEINENDRIISFHNEKDHHMYATGGLYYFRINIRKQLEAAVSSGLERLRNFFNMLLSSNTDMKIYRFCKIIDVDHIQDIKEAEEFLNSLYEQE